MKVNFVAFGSLGDVVPIIKLAQDSASAGMEVSIAAETPFADVIARAGLTYYPLTSRSPEQYYSVFSEALSSTQNFQERSKNIFEMVFRPLGSEVLASVSRLSSESDLLVLTGMAMFPLSVPGCVSANPKIAVLLTGHPLIGFFDRLTTAARISKIFCAVPEWWGVRGNSQRKIENLEFLGFINAGTPGAQSMNKNLEDFVASGTPPVVITMGTTSGMYDRLTPEFFSNACKMYGHRCVVLGNSPPIVPAEHRKWLHYETDFTSLACLLQNASAVVHAGGIGTTGLTITSGRAAVTIPQHSEQAETAQRLMELVVSPGYLMPHDVTERSLGVLIDEAISNPKYGSNALFLDRSESAGSSRRQFVAWIQSSSQK